MKRLFLFGVLFSACIKQDKITAFEKSNSIAQQPKNIIVVIEENHALKNIIGNKDAPFINSLADSGELFTNFHAITHPSYPNYIALFSGSTQGIRSDTCLEEQWNVPNVYSELNNVGKSCAWYSEDLPAEGSTVCKAAPYAERHNPSTLFANVPASANKPFTEFPANYSSLENIVFITPNLNHDMHNGTVRQGDDWLKNNLSRSIGWCKKYNALFILIWDEDDRHSANNIPVIMYGKNIAVSEDSDYYTHYDMTKTLCSLMGADTSWTVNLNTAKMIH